jgi:hypothetical protein
MWINRWEMIGKDTIDFSAMEDVNNVLENI